MVHAKLELLEVGKLASAASPAACSGNSKSLFKALDLIVFVRL